ncbi:MAG: hypothetical protein PHT83_03055 [Bacilli bacterium]|nr:hypothetical protein [Bacilli bacterium]
MNKKISFFRLSLRKILESFYDKIFAIVNISLVLGLGIVVISMGISFIKYKNYVEENSQYLYQMAYFKNVNPIDETINNIITDNNKESRLIYKTDLEITKINDVDITSFELKLELFKSTNNSFLMPKEITSNFEVIGKTVIEENEIILDYAYAAMLGEILVKEYQELLGDTFRIGDSDYEIVGITSIETSQKILSFMDPGIFANYNFFSNEGVLESATIDYNNLDEMVLDYNLYKTTEIQIYESIDEIKETNLASLILSTIFIALGIVISLVSYGIIQSSVNQTFINSLSFISILKIIGIKNRKITIFNFSNSVVLILFSYLLAIPLSYSINFIINKFVDSKAIFVGFDFEMFVIDYKSLLISLGVAIFLGSISFGHQIFKIKNLNASSIHLLELEA